MELVSLLFHFSNLLLFFWLSKFSLFDGTVRDGVVSFELCKCVVEYFLLSLQNFARMILSIHCALQTTITQTDQSIKYLSWPRREPLWAKSSLLTWIARIEFDLLFLQIWRASACSRFALLRSDGVYFRSRLHLVQSHLKHSLRAPWALFTRY